MDADEVTAKASDQKRINVSSLEQRQKFEELRERRLKLKNAQEAREKKKLKKRKRGKQGNEHSGTNETKPSVEEHNSPERAKFGSEQKHIFSLNCGENTSLEAAGGNSSRSRAGPAFGGDGNVEMTLSTTTTSQSPFGTAAEIPAAQNTEVPQKKPKRKKLHWGMEIKERWERKGNM